MRFGRIFLALLAPLLSLMALKTETSIRKPISADSPAADALGGTLAANLVDLLRSATPAAVSSAVSGAASLVGNKDARGTSYRFPPALLAHAVLVPVRRELALRPVSTQANLELLSRQTQRFLLRC
jgi:hypothetical protein